MSDNQQAEAATDSKELIILVTVALITMLAPLNSTMIGVALPRIMTVFGADLAASSWLVTTYLITMASLQPLAGNLGDRWGRRRLILGGLVYFGLASLGAGLAPNLLILVFFRVQQAIAGAIALPNGMALMRELVPAERRASRFGLIGSIIVIAAAGGPPLGGVLIELAGWRAIFFVNLFPIIPALFLSLRVLPIRPRRPASAPFDLAGALLLLVVLVGLSGLLSQGRRFTTPWSLLAASLLLALLAGGFLWREWRHPAPVLQPRFFTRRSFAAASLSVCLSNLAMYSTFLAIPILLAGRPGWSTAGTGGVLVALWAPSIVINPLGGHLADRWGRRWPTGAGLLLLTVGFGLLLAMGTSVTLPLLLSGLSIAGIGLGLSYPGMQTAALEAVHKHEAGAASGIYSTSRYLGSIIGSSVLAILYGQEAGPAGAVGIFLMVTVAAFGSLLASLMLEDRPRAPLEARVSNI